MASCPTRYVLRALSTGALRKEGPGRTCPRRDQSRAAIPAVLWVLADDSEVLKVQALHWDFMTRFGSLSLALLFLASPLFAETAILRGTVTDQSGAFIPGASVALTAPDGSMKRATAD